MKESKVRNHKLADKNPILCSILLGVLGIIIMQCLMFAINAVLAIFIAGYSRETGPVGIIVAAALLLLVYKNWFKPNYVGAIRVGAYKNIWVAIIAYFAFLILSLIFDKFLGNSRMIFPTFSSLCLALMAGVTEEACFRGLMIPVLLRNNSSKKSILTALMVSSIVFGLVHGTNIFAGADPLVTIVQVIATFFAGVVLGSIFLFSGNILIPMAVHVFHDIIAFSSEDMGNSNGVITHGLDLVSVISTCFAAVMFAVVFYYTTRPQNIERIQKLWEKKWSVGETRD